MQLLKRLRYLFEPRALVLMYHRVAELSRDPWQLAVSPQNFEQHLQVLQKTGKLISVNKLVSALHQNAIVPDSICITFDDGYSDNYLAAKPLIEKYASAATFFIPTHYPGSERQFWWDELESIMLSYPALPGKLVLPVGEAVFEFDLQNDDVLTNEHILQHKTWAWPAKAPNRRCELYLAAWELLKPLPFDELQSVLEQIKRWASFTAPADRQDFPMSSEQLKDLATHAFISLGLHTVTHPALACQSRQVQHLEMIESKKYLESISGQRVDSIAYPYGSYNDDSLSVVGDLQLGAAFTTAEKAVTNQTDPYRIGRFQVKDWNGKEFEKWLLTWKKSPQFL